MFNCIALFCDISFTGTIGKVRLRKIHYNKNHDGSCLLFYTYEIIIYIGKVPYNLNFILKKVGP